MSKTEKMTERVTVKMDANLKAKLQREAERCGVDMSAYIRSLIENRLSQAAGTCYNCIGRLEKALDAEDVGYELHSFIRSKYKQRTVRANGNDLTMGGERDDTRCGGLRQRPKQNHQSRLRS